MGCRLGPQSDHRIVIPQGIVAVLIGLLLIQAGFRLVHVVTISCRRLAATAPQGPRRWVLPPLPGHCNRVKRKGYGRFSLGTLE